MHNIVQTIPSQLLRTLFLRGALLWLLARIFGKATLASAGMTAAEGLVLPVWAVAITASLVLADLHRRKEIALLHNLGIRTFDAVAMAALPAIVLEGLLVMLVP